MCSLFLSVCCCYWVVFAGWLRIINSVILCGSLPLSSPGWFPYVWLSTLLCSQNEETPLPLTALSLSLSLPSPFFPSFHLPLFATAISASFSVRLHLVAFGLTFIPLCGQFASYCLVLINCFSLLSLCLSWYSAPVCLSVYQSVSLSCFAPFCLNPVHQTNIIS